MDYVDLYQIHRFDDHTPIEETLEALHDVVRAGKALYIGASSMYAYQFVKMLYTQRAHGWTRVRLDAESLQPGVSGRRARHASRSASKRASASFPGARWRAASSPAIASAASRRRRYAISTTPAAIRLYYADADYDIVDRVVEVAKQKGVLPIQVALAWVVNKPGVTAPIVSATKLEQLDQLVEGLSVKLTPEEIAAVEEPYVPHKVIGIV